MAIIKKRKSCASPRWRLHLLTGIWCALVLAAVAALALQCRRIQPDAVAIGEQRLAQLEDVRLPGGAPDTVVRCPGFTVHFNAQLHIPNYVAYRLTSAQLDGAASYSGTFFADEAVRGCAAPADYAHSGYQRGHMAPAADMKWSEEALKASYAMVNVCPQRRALNEGVWRQIEEKVREWAQRDSVLLVLTGPVARKRAATIGSACKVAVPEGFFKVVLAPRAKPARAIAFVVPNDTVDYGTCSQYAESVSEVERATGYDFFHTLSEREQRALEGRADKATWFQF